MFMSQHWKWQETVAAYRSVPLFLLAVALSTTFVYLVLHCSCPRSAPGLRHPPPPLSRTAEESQLVSI